MRIPYTVYTFMIFYCSKTALLISKRQLNLDKLSVSRFLSITPPSQPIQNVRNIRYREDILDMHAFMNLSEVRQLSSDWQIEYNYDRGRDSLGGKSPIEYARSFSPLAPVSGEGPKGKKQLCLC